MRSDITDHLFIPQSHISNMCVCGEPNTAHVSVPTPVAPSFHMETSVGGIPVTLCAVDLLNDQIEYLKSLLADLLVDCENWGCAPDERYAEALRWEDIGYQPVDNPDA